MSSDEGVRRVESQVAARALAEQLLDHSRLRPVIVVSCAAGQTEPYVNVEEVQAAIRGLADVYILPSGDVSWAFSSLMPDRTQVYGGACRVYPVDPAWTTDPLLSPLRFAYTSADAEGATEQIISDAMSMAVAAGLLERRISRRAVEASGVVEGVVGGRAFVRTDHHGMLTVWPTTHGARHPARALVHTGHATAGRSGHRR